MYFSSDQHHNPMSHPTHLISTTTLIAPHALTDKIFITIYCWYPDRNTYLSIPMCPSHSLCPCSRIFAQELGGVIFRGGWLCYGPYDWGCGAVVLSGKESPYTPCVHGW